MAAPLDALAASEPKPKKVSAGQRNRLEKLLAALTVLAGDYETDIKEAEKPEYKDELPPSALPKSKIELASLKESMAGLDLTLGDGWQGDVKDALKKANECYKAANAHYVKFSKRLREAAEEVDLQHVKLEKV